MQTNTVKTTSNNIQQVRDIIHNILDKTYPNGYDTPFFADDTRFGTGYAFKYHRSSAYNDIWPLVLQELHNLDFTSWKMSCPIDYTDSDHPVPAKWVGIRSEQLPRKRRK